MGRTEIKMVEFLPFSGYRPSLKNDKIDDCVSPPYDVIGDEQLRKLQSMKHNVTRLTLMPKDGRYHESRKELESWISDGSLIKDKDSFYLYRQTFTDSGKLMMRTGMVGTLKTEPYENGSIIPHEETFSKVKEDRLNLLRDMEAHLESIFGIFEGFSKELNSKIVENAVKIYDLTDAAGVRHEYLRVSEPKTVAAITKELKDQKMLIADGHHRYETALNYSLENPDDQNKGYVLATLVASNDPGLVIWPTHRLLNSTFLNEANAISKIRERMTIKEVPSEEALKKELPNWQMGLMFRSGKCYVAKLEDQKDPLWTLDTYVAQETIIKGIYGYENGKVEVSYDAELPSVLKKMKEGKHDLAIILNEPELKTIWDLSAIGKRMPKKTTFFYPKIWSGFIFYKMK